MARTYFVSVVFDPGNDIWSVVLVYRDGNPIELATFDNEEEAEWWADGFRAGKKHGEKK